MMLSVPRLCSIHYSLLNLKSEQHVHNVENTDSLICYETDINILE
jgi:hypothetical protein